MSEALAAPETAVVDGLEVRQGDLAVLGDFSGVPAYVLEPTLGAGALDRLRARSFKVNAYARLVVRRIQQDLVPDLRVVYAAAGRFLLAGPARGTAEPILASFQRNLDEWAYRQLRGEMQVHLATARCEGERLPVAALGDKLAQRRLRPLEGALLQGAYWNAGAFFNASAAAGQERCCACGVTDTLHGDVCMTCLEDQELGRALPSARFGRWVAESAGQVSIPGLGLALGDSGDLDLAEDEWPLLRYVPTVANAGGALEPLAEVSPGRRKLLACLAVDVDHAAKAQVDCHGDAEAIRQWSRRLHAFFSGHSQRLIESQFPALYPVHGGGDDLLIVGPWNKALDFVIQLRRDFEVHTESQMTLSAGLAWTHPGGQLRASASQALEQVKLAKGRGGNSLALFGKTVSWDEAGRLAERIPQVARWLKEGRLSGSVLRRVTELQRLSIAGIDGWRLRYLPLLAWQARKVASQEVRDWLHRLGGSAEWSSLELLAEMALLASGKAEPARKS